MFWTRIAVWLECPTTFWIIILVPTPQQHELHISTLLMLIPSKADNPTHMGTCSFGDVHQLLLWIDLQIQHHFKFLSN